MVGGGNTYESRNMDGDVFEGDRMVIDYEGNGDNVREDEVTRDGGECIIYILNCQIVF